jgi:hypothetical protein
VQGTGLSLIRQGSALALANNGTAVSGATIFVSHDAASNIDGAQHVLSGVSADGTGSIRIGFEDQLRSASDDDFQDVVMLVHAVPQAHIIAGEYGYLAATSSDPDADFFLL